MEQKKVDHADRTNRFLPLVSNKHEGALPIHSTAQVHSSFLQAGQTLDYKIKDEHGIYLYVLEGGPIKVNEHSIPTLGAAKIIEETEIRVKAEMDSELLLLDVLLI